MRSSVVADPEDSQMRRSSKSWAKVKNLLFGKIFAENCMKMKEMGPRGDARPWAQIYLKKMHLPFHNHVRNNIFVLSKERQ